MKTRIVRLIVVIAALAVVAAIVPAGRAVFTGVTDKHRQLVRLGR